MNKNFSLSKTTVYLLLLIVALLIYVFVYFMPAQSQLALLRSEISLFNVETATYREYLQDSSPLEADIQAIQDEIDRMNAEDYTNDSTVSFEIGDAIQRYKVSLVSINIESPSVQDDYRILPINLQMTGDMENLQKFISHFENNEDGSYLVHGTAFEIAANTTELSMVIYLCTPNV